ncbi:MAG: hypothetical protein S4CHLAM2_09850 [Chlamydiales bacterium]|nr:hypothetical protein [Chlamydiales bacterium]
MLEEELRLEEDEKRERNWKRWGPYLSERQWATVREDYSSDGNSWDFFPHDQARSRAYRWGEDGLLGITDREARLCFALALWNRNDPILKERLFGLTSTQGNHGEDVKECYYYLDSSPTHSYMKALYKYPQKEYPYQNLIDENQRRGLLEREFELVDTGIFDENRYFDVFATYAKEGPNNILIRIEVYNRGSEEASLCVLPTLWFRNTWSWGGGHEGCTPKLSMHLNEEGIVEAAHPTLGKFFFAFENTSEVLFTENESNLKKLYGKENTSAYVKDAFHRYVINGDKKAVNPAMNGSKVAPLYRLKLKPGESKQIECRLFSAEEPSKENFEAVFSKRKEEADQFYAAKILSELTPEAKEVSRQAYAGLLWSKQFYHYVVKEWLSGDSGQPIPPKERKEGRNHEWVHFFARDVISMPDKWEYPWFAAWDLAFHMIPFAQIDPVFAKKQMILFLREWYMHPNGQQPAYEYGFSDVNPPVHAWACWRIYKMTGAQDIPFLESAFQKLLLNFTWWVNRKDVKGQHIFAGGFLGLDNIGVFDRSKPLPAGGELEQADGTAWMAFYCLTMLRMALELAVHNPVYEDMASKFFEHFVHIADSMNEFKGTGLWDEEDGFYYDRLKVDGDDMPLKTRSLVGLIPLIAVEILEDAHLKRLKGFAKRMDWFIRNRGDLEDVVTFCSLCPVRGHRILAIPSKERLTRILRYVLDEAEFLSPYGIRSLSKVYGAHPYKIELNHEQHTVDYVPGESNSYMFGGNSNWRGPIWFPLNYLIIDALERYYQFYGDDFKVECPTGSGIFLNLQEVRVELNRRLCGIFHPGASGGRPCHGGEKRYAEDPHWKDLLLFNEYFHAETGRGLGASHQTGWTALISKILEESLSPQKACSKS